MTSGTGVLLLSAIGGYWVLERAATHKDGLKKIGQLLGSAIILVSLVGIVCKVWYAAACQMGASGKGGLCPFMSSRPAPSQTK